MTRIPWGLELEPEVQPCVFGIISRGYDGPIEVRILRNLFEGNDSICVVSNPLLGLLFQ